MRRQGLIAICVVALAVVAAVAVAWVLLPSSAGANPSNIISIDVIPYQVDDDGDTLVDEDPVDVPGSAAGTGIDSDGDTAVDEDGPSTVADAVETSRTVLGSTPFDVSVNLTWGGTPEERYQGYQMVLQYDASILAFMPTQDANADTFPESGTYTGLGGVVFYWSDGAFDADGDTLVDAVPGGAARVSGTSDASGQAVLLRLKCVGNGTSPLHLMAAIEDPRP
jgi:hypothetical protein